MLTIFIKNHFDFDIFIDILKYEGLDNKFLFFMLIKTCFFDKHIDCYGFFYIRS